VFKPGDIIGLGIRWRDRWIPSTEPHTDVAHHMIVVMPMPGDCAVLESDVPFGVRMGKLSWYLGRFIRVMRAPDKTAARMAVYEAVSYGRHCYGYFTAFVWLLQAAKYFLTHGFAPVPYRYISDIRCKGVTCTELVARPYERYCRLVPHGIAPTQSAIEQARLDGKLTTIFEGILTHEVLSG